MLIFLWLLLLNVEIHLLVFGLDLLILLRLQNENVWNLIIFTLFLLFDGLLLLLCHLFGLFLLRQNLLDSFLVVVESGGFQADFV